MKYYEEEEERRGIGKSSLRRHSEIYSKCCHVLWHKSLFAIPLYQATLKVIFKNFLLNIMTICICSIHSNTPSLSSSLFLTFPAPAGPKLITLILVVAAVSIFVSR